MVKLPKIRPIIQKLLHQGFLDEAHILGKVRLYIEEAYKKYRSYSLHLLPAHIAFFLLWSIVPLMLLWDLVQKFFDVVDFNLADVNLHFVNEFLDTEQVISQIGFSWSGLIILCTVIYFSSRAFYSIIHASNYVYGLQKDKNFIKTRAKGILLSVCFVLSFVIMIVLTILGQGILDLLEHLLGASRLIDAFRPLRWPIAAVVLFFMVFLLYWIAPSKQLYWKVSVPGTIFTVTLWGITSWGYSLYLSYFANYARVYTSFANIIMLMVWLYLISYVFVLGILLNAVYLERFADPTGETTFNNDIQEEFPMGPPRD